MIPVRTFDSLMEAAHGYQLSMMLFAALRLDLFSVIADKAKDAGTLSRMLPADRRNLSILMDALVAMGLLKKSGDRYRNSELSRDFLADGPRSRRFILLHHLDCWSDWGSLDRKVRGYVMGRAGGSGFQENFIRGMEENARERAVQVAARMPLKAGERVLDLGGGPGTYAVEWAKRYPGAEITVFDIPETLRVTRKILKEKGVSRLVRIAEGDFTRDELGGTFDLIWISQILHAYSEQECIALLRKAKRSLSPGGRVAVQEFLLEENKTAPPGPAFFSVHMVAVTEGGRSYSGKEIVYMLKKAGFRRIYADKPDPRGVGIVSAVS